MGLTGSEMRDFFCYDLIKELGELTGPRGCVLALLTLGPLGIPESEESDVDHAQRRSSLVRGDVPAAAPFPDRASADGSSDATGREMGRPSQLGAARNFAEYRGAQQLPVRDQFAQGTAP